MKKNVPANIQVKRNKYGNYEHTETGLVFDKFDKRVIGRQKLRMVGDNEEAYIAKLTSEDIELCNQYKFDYMLPANLSDGKTKNVKIDEVDDDECEGEGEAEAPSLDDDDESDGLDEFYESE